MAGAEEKSVKGGLEFIPLRPGETEDMYRTRPGKRSPGQMLLGFMSREPEGVGTDGSRRK